MPKLEVTENRSIAILLTKEEAARFKDEMDDVAKILKTTHIVPNGSPFRQIHDKIVSALYQSMRETNWVGPVE